jgi:hypothetical protein
MDHELCSHEFSNMLHSVIDQAKSKREEAEIIIEIISETGLINNGHQDQLDVKTLLLVTLRLRLLEQFCKSLLNTFPVKGMVIHSIVILFNTLSRTIRH